MRPHARARRWCVPAVAVACLASPVAALPAAAAGSDGARSPGVVYTAPVDGDVVAPFDPPEHPYGRGHRGVDLAVRAGGHVAAAADGVVVFAGVVAGQRWVTLAHADGILTSYGPLGSIAVTARQTLRRGDTLGTAGGGDGHHDGSVHFSARRDGVYIDPLSLLQPWRPALVGPGGWRFADMPALPRYEPWRGGRWGGLRVADSPVATGPGYVFAPNPNHAIVLAGLGTRTGEPPLAMSDLAYAPDDVTVFSYAGVDSRGRPLPYDVDDTWQRVHQAALALRDTLRARQAAAPGQAVDLVGHSLGGVTALWYLLFLHDPYDPTLPPVGNVVTIAAPLGGSDAATAVDRLRDDAESRRLLHDLHDHVLATDPFGLADDAARHHPAAPVIADLRTGSQVVRDLRRRWDDAVADLYAGPLASGTRVLTIGATSDLFAPEHRSGLPGADHLVLPGGHDRVRRTEAVRQVVHQFLAYRPLPDSPGVLARLLSRDISTVEQVLGLALDALGDPPTRHEVPMPVAP